MDEITFEILEDGRIRVTTGQIGQVNHLNAEDILAFISKAMGGKIEIQKRKDAIHVHHHNHTHKH